MRSFQVLNYIVSLAQLNGGVQFDWDLLHNFSIYNRVILKNFTFFTLTKTNYFFSQNSETSTLLVEIYRNVQRLLLAVGQDQS